MAVKQNNTDRKIGGSAAKSVDVEISSNSSDSVKMDKKKALSELSKVLDLIDLTLTNTELTGVIDILEEKDYCTIFLQLEHVEVPNTALGFQKFKRDIQKVVDFFKEMPPHFYRNLLDTTCVLIANPETTPSCALSIIFQILPIIGNERKSIEKEVEFMLFSFEKASDVEIIKFVVTLCDWMVFCTFLCPNLHIWITEILDKLREDNKYKIVNQIGLRVINPLCTKMIVPLLRPSIAPIIFDILSSDHCTSEILREISTSILAVSEQLRKESKKCSDTKEIYEEFLTVVSTAMKHRRRTTIDPVLEIFSEKHPPCDTVKNKNYESPCKKSATKKSSRGKKNSRTGIVNLGNDCYMISVLQALLMTPRLRDEILITNLQTQMFSQMQSLFSELLYTKEDYITPTKYLEKFRPTDFDEETQQDSSEFLSHLLTQLHDEESNSSRLLNERSLDVPAPTQLPSSATLSLEMSIIQRLFVGTLLTIMECRRCGRKSNVRDSFHELQLAIPSQHYTDDGSKTRKSTHLRKLTIQDLIDYYFSIETLANDLNSGYECTQCKSINTTDRQNHLIIFPNYLILHVKQFHFDIHKQQNIKLKTRITLCEYISLELFNEDNDSDTNTNTNSINVAKYKLYGVIVHAGTQVNFGHYYTYAVDDDNQWHKFNDEDVQKCELSEVLNLRPPQTPYIVFYSRSDATNDCIEAGGDVSTSSSPDVNFTLRTDDDSSKGTSTKTETKIHPVTECRSRSPNNFDILRSLNVVKRRKSFEKRERIKRNNDKDDDNNNSHNSGNKKDPARRNNDKDDGMPGDH